mmetsp:Transcript_2327/g.3252  ORF Transcript_2327/g.3252 Transcript_2327/m.3252 type:complete len:105 (-) Transcript_2327:47-361(-)
MGYCEALKTKGVVLWGLTFFCIKFAVYSLLLWMPLFLESELAIDKNKIANLLSLFEVGVMIGVLILGVLSDVIYSRRAPICMLFIAASSAICFTITFRYAVMSR